MNNTITSNTNKIDKLMSIKEVCKQYELSEVYVRRMILQGKISTQKVQIMNNTFKHMIKESEIIRWRSSTKTSGRRRVDGRNKYSIYGTSDEIELIQKLLDSNKVQTPLIRSNIKKIKTG